MDGGSVGLVHFVKLINSTNAPVRQYQRPSLQRQFSRGHILGDRRCQSHAARAFSGRIHTSWGNASDMLQQLTFRHSRIAHEANVYVTANPHSIRKFAGASPNKLQQQCPFNVLVAKNLGGNRTAKGSHWIVPVRNLLDPLVQLRLLLLAQMGVARFIVALFMHKNVLRLEEGGCHQPSLHGPVPALRHPLREEHTVDRDHVPRARRTRQLPAAVHAHAPGNVPHGHLVRQLLQFDLLELDELASPRLQVQRVPALRLTTALLTGALPLGEELSLRLDHLVDFAAARVARVGGDRARRLDVRGTHDHPAEGHEVSHGAGANLTQAHPLDLWSTVQLSSRGRVRRGRGVAILPIERGKHSWTLQRQYAQLVSPH
mmetsp:Transcript_13138/g.28397  ORF Transcript_13138/g.28397 Transcript_13138/m.28397 type:complete len:373 (+) Transcript_13138:1042-2160(+)